MWEVDGRAGEEEPVRGAEGMGRGEGGGVGGGRASWRRRTGEGEGGGGGLREGEGWQRGGGGRPSEHRPTFWPKLGCSIVMSHSDVAYDCVNHKNARIVCNTWVRFIWVIYQNEQIAFTI